MGRASPSATTVRSVGAVRGGHCGFWISEIDDIPQACILEKNGVPVNFSAFAICPTISRQYTKKILV